MAEDAKERLADARRRWSMKNDVEHVELDVEYVELSLLSLLLYFLL